MVGIKEYLMQKVARASYRRVAQYLLAFMVASVGIRAEATVVQVDGTIVPVIINPGGDCSDGGDIQDCLNDEEGYSPPSSNAIGAIVDAAMVPEVFTPSTTGVVTFKDVAEGAGFENSFGYYNIGDDVTNTANLHPILGCGVSASTHTGEVPNYIVDAEPDGGYSTTTVNFATERTAGRYKGGFIGFYLITPQNHDGSYPSDALNCGDFVGSGRTFGYIYFTQRDLNNDGDFVHHLVYGSKITADRFYFGFEDLFRGGDNDFEDMLIQVTGLTPPCTPKAEVCDNLDNDCDGSTDENTVDTGSSCVCDNVSLTCVGGTRQGVCRTGVSACVSGAIVCQSTVNATGEVCNNLDDDCDGQVDESVSQTCYTATGGTQGVGECKSGTQSCVAGSWGQCVGEVTPTSETCNGKDDDCDGTTDDSPVDVGQTCDGSDTDLCPEGTTYCDIGLLKCSDTSSNSIEYCNNFDDDCDGTTDESPVDVGQACSVGLGACARQGATVCTGGVPVCGAVAGSPTTEVCNGADDDCDGLSDEGFNVGTACEGRGECGAGVIECASPTATRCSTDPGGSADQSVAEVCNGKDDDCDGQTDEGLNDLGACGTNTGECSEGRSRCISGAVTCQGGIASQPESCNNKDDDCDGVTDERTGDPGDTNHSGLTDEGAPCGHELGECEAGTYQCAGGILQCVGGSEPQPETCNALDDDCNGVRDDNPVDVGKSCGITAEGECAFGQTICVSGGQIACNGNIDPTFETCNGKDDDCDGQTDEDAVDVGQSCGSSQGDCVPGIYQCIDGVRTCVGGSVGVPEICDGIDNNCNNIIDDDVTDEGAVCGADEGVCEKGHEQCIDGKLQCIGVVLPGTEVCNCLDDDCDKEVDEGDLCSGGGCVDCHCTLPCAKSVEFTSCPLGQTCVNDYCVPDDCYLVECGPAADGTATSCQKGECVPVCDAVECNEPYVCRHTDGACVGNNCLYLPYLCTEDQLCIASECRDDLCKGVECEEGQFCRDGACVKSCADVVCRFDHVCSDGNCVAKGCGGKCAETEVCNAETDTCVDNPCLSANSCGSDHVCDPQTGSCIIDPCATITCPSPSTCEFGQCVSISSLVKKEDAGTSQKYVVAAGGAHCSTTIPGSGGGGLVCFFAFSMLMAGWFRRRRASSGRTGGALASAMAAFFLLGGCNVEPYCLDCANKSSVQPEGGMQEGGGSSLSDGSALVDGSSGKTECVPTRQEDDLCNGVDDDCDGETDEEFNLLRDVDNCGECGRSCAMSGSRTVCDQGQCYFVDCFPGYLDLNGDTSSGTESADGCEYECFVSNDEIESCDGLDNNCDGQTDEDTSFKTDAQNCGKCGRVCKFFHAAGSCSEGKCRFDPLTECEAGWIDGNGVQADGCEMECEPTNGGMEACDGLDNDCDGQVDEDFALQTNPNNCGTCGRQCNFPNAVAHCQTGQCLFDPLVDCNPGYVDDNGNQLDGCELECTQSNGGVEICDGKDNDCNGIVDGATTDSGAICNFAPGGVATGACADDGLITCVTSEPTPGQRVGTLVCSGATKAKAEVCNNQDDDCDGQTDETPVDVGRVCLTPQGECSAGFTVCRVGGQLDCVRAVVAAAEVCDGLDNDCDGTADNHLTDPGIGQPCGTTAGVCIAGVRVCANGGLICQGETPPSVEVCNGQDDDCDGSTDEGAVGVGQSCGSDVGACVPGSLICSGGALSCNGGVAPADETCNGIDDDCDGQTDENTSGGVMSRACYDGPTNTQGHGICVGGTQTCIAGNWGPCVGEVVPSPDTCNNIDDDCDSSTDEGLSVSCYTGSTGTLGIGNCHAGTRACVGGTYSGTCTGQVTPVAETCDGTDQDCDGVKDEDASGNALTQNCYSGASGTSGVGSCHSGTQTCAYGSFGVCVGEVIPRADVCGDTLDTDCDGSTDEGCPTTNTEIRLDPGSAGAYHSYDIDVAVAGATLGSDIYMVWSDKRNATTQNDTVDVYLARSTDGGVTFNTAQNLTNSVGEEAVKPRVIAAWDSSISKDRVYVAYQKVVNNIRQLHVLRSSDSGVTFSTIAIASTANTDNFKHDIAISANGQNAVVVWEQLATLTLARDVVARSSNDSGATWTTARRVNIAGGTAHLAGKPKAVITGNGTRVFVWREARSPRTTFDIYAIYATHAELSSGDPATSREKRLDGDTGDTRQSDDLAIATAGNNSSGANNVYVAWNDLSTTVTSDADVVFSRSTDNGATWSAAAVIDDPSNEVSRSYPPVMAVDPAAPSTTTDDRIFIAWPDRREGSQIYAARSVDSGASFAAGRRASNNGGLPISNVASEPRIAFGGGDLVIIAYVQTDSSNISHIYAARSVDAAANWSYTDVHIDGVSGTDAVSPAIGRINASGHASGALISWVDFRNDSDHVDGDIYRRMVWQ
jgi:Notch 1